jgi:hypothetical protein
MKKEMKWCWGCGFIKSLDDFHRDRTHRDGHKSLCKQCRKDPAAAERRYWQHNNAYLTGGILPEGYGNDLEEDFLEFAAELEKRLEVVR